MLLLPPVKNNNTINPTDITIAGNRLTLKQCSVSNAIKAISSMTVIETNESYAALPTATPEAGFVGTLTNNGETYNYFMFVDIKNNSWRLVATDSTYTNVATLGSGTLENFVENSSYISFYTMETFGTVKIYKNNLLPIIFLSK